MSRFETITPVFENTVMTACYDNDNGLGCYDIAPVEGYVLHDKKRDTYEYDEEGNVIGEAILGYTSGSLSVGYNYNFDKNPREIYAVLSGTVK